MNEFAHLRLTPDFVCRVSVSTISRIWITVEIMNFKSCPRDGTLVRNPLKLIFFLKVINIFLVIGIQAVEKLCWLFLFPAYSLLAAEYGVWSPSYCPSLPDLSVPAEIVA